MLRINAFGCMRVASDAGELTGAANQPRRLAVLAVLARAGDRGIRREKILALLWPDAEEEQARKTFAKALHALRRDLGAEDALVGGMTDLRLNPEVISSDVGEFELALSEGDLERAARLYAGPFLDAFRVPGAPEFERWADTERVALAREYEHALEKLAASESARADHPAAVRWLRKLAAEDPLNARHALRLMRALADAGDRLGALQHARVYEALVDQQLDMPPDREVVAFAVRLRREHAEAPPPAENWGQSRTPSSERRTAARGRAESALVEPAWTEAEAAPVDSAALESMPAVVSAPQSTTPRRRRFGAWVAVAAVAAVAGALAWAARGGRAAASTIGGTLIAVGSIADYRQPATPELARPLADMLATNLARAPALRVLSTARMYELLADNGGTRDTSSGALVLAARRAGATRLVDGALFQLAGGQLRLDLRLVDLSTGSVAVARSVTGTDPFALADSATALLVAEAGGVAPLGSIADVSTRSMVAYRLYEEGLRAFYQNDRRSAQQFFDAAFAEDTTFAMAAYYAALTRRDNIRETLPRFERALRLAGRTSDRERLIILAHWALLTYSPALGALADTLSMRYPHEVEGHLFSGAALFKLARYPEAIAALERAVAMDSASLSGAGAGCLACDALEYLVRAYRAADDYAGAERVVRRWLRLQPRSAQAWEQLHGVLASLGRTDEALDALRRRVSVAPPVVAREPVLTAQLRLMAGDYATAERLLDAYVASTVDTARLADATWYLVILYRNEGRLREALDAARRYRALMTPVRDTAPELWLPEAQVRLESGEHRRAAAMFDTVAAFETHGRLSPNRARGRVWRLAQVATALASVGDTAPLLALADTMRALGAGSGEARDQRLHHYVRGLMLGARGRDDDAAAELALALSSGPEGYTRINLEVARTALRRGRPRDAIAALQPALRGLIEGSGYYATRTELHELLARAWAAAGVRDSARGHHRAVVSAWERADAAFAARRDSARRAMELR